MFTAFGAQMGLLEWHSVGQEHSKFVGHAEYWRLIFSLQEHLGIRKTWSICRTPRDHHTSQGLLFFNHRRHRLTFRSLRHLSSLVS